MIRTPLALVPYLLAVAALAAGLLWHAGDALQRAGNLETTGEAAIGGSFTLIDQDGKPRRSGDFSGHFMLIYFGYSYCPDICPTRLAVMADALDKLADTDRVVPVFITIDPARDTSGVLKAYLKAFGPRFVGLTGDAKAIDSAAGAYRVFYRKHPLAGGGYAMDHSSQIYLMGPDGKFIAAYDEAFGPDRLAAELKKRL